MLGVSAGTLRRLAKEYAASFTELPTDGAGGRVYPDDALNVMQEARELVRSRRVGTLEKAFELLSNGSLDIVPSSEAQSPDPLLSELRSIRQVLERVVADNEALRWEVKALREQVKALPAPQESPPDDYSARLTLLERRNTYLEGELKRRDTALQQRQAWFPRLSSLWGKK